MNSCILSKFYIKPQPFARVRELLKGCILSKFYIKPQRQPGPLISTRGCILSKFYIKPQHGKVRLFRVAVVSYRNSTSNHNLSAYPYLALGLYLIEILHQTTTCGKCDECLRRCILSKFYIKPQRWPRRAVRESRCILSKFYIKPQLPAMAGDLLKVVSYRNSTSNHNAGAALPADTPLYLIEILHQTTTASPPYARPFVLYLIEILHQTTTTLADNGAFNSCILSKFYIKPQLAEDAMSACVGCILSKFYIKPQLLPYRSLRSPGCILSKFYIKPQQNRSHKNAFGVVSYRNSTSNHNLWTTKSASEMLYLIEILHQTTTVNPRQVHELAVVSYRNSTSNHNRPVPRDAGRRVVSYRNSTSNHN